MAAGLAGTIGALTVATAVQAQTPPARRADLAGTLGWLTVHKDSPSAPYDDNDWHSSLFVAVSGGWYWTDNLKTELDVGAGTSARHYQSRLLTISGRTGYAVTESTFSRRVFGVSQQYQFFRNAWFHPHLAAGVNVSFERIEELTNPVVVFDQVTRTTSVLAPAVVAGPRSDVLVSPFLATGFKAYLGERAFFRSDLRVAFRGGVDDLMLRAGFGFDF